MKSHTTPSPSINHFLTQETHIKRERNCWFIIQKHNTDVHTYGDYIGLNNQGTSHCNKHTVLRIYR